MQGIPPFVDASRPFLGLLATRAQMEVATFLIANGGDAFSLEDLKQGTGLSRSSVREAVRALRAWGQTVVANPPSKRPRFIANEESPITMALHILTAAAADAAWPSEREFPRVVADVAEAIGASFDPIFTGSFVEVARGQTTYFKPVKATPLGTQADVIYQRTTEARPMEA